MKTMVGIESFKQLDEPVKRKAILAGKINFARAYAQYIGYENDKNNLDATEAWHLAMNAVDRTYGTCTCGDKNADEQCPSYVEHNLVNWFIEKMEEAGSEAADLGIRLHAGTLEFYTETISDKAIDLVVL
jgi:hypothetical protein